MLISALGYALTGLSLIHGAIFGFILGFSITLFSLVFITNLNKRVLPVLSEIYWLPLSIFFSFLSGFLGTYVGVYIAHFLEVELISTFFEKLFYISFAIGILTYIVGALLYRFVKMRNQKEVVDNEYIKSRLSSLETQLNPHFLFNALNSIAELIHHDTNKAELAILKVSSFLRNTMSEVALLNLTDELRNVKDYIELENIRFSNQISLHVKQKIPLWKLPKFSLQLLVENAIKHGFVSSDKELQIWISFDEKNKKILIKNDGEPIKSHKFGVGLNNLKQRLELLCHGNIKIVDKKIPTFEITLGECSEDIDSRR